MKEQKEQKGLQKTIGKNEYLLKNFNNKFSKKVQK